MTGTLPILKYGVLDTGPEVVFDDIVALASHLCDAPTALVSLLDNDRQWFKARVGFDCDQTDLDRSVCRFVVEAAATIVIPDLTADPRTSTNPLVTGEPHLRFYAGAPINSPWGALGALCVLDTKPRPEGISAAQQSCLEALARQVGVALEARRDSDQLREVAASRQRLKRWQDALLKMGDMLRDRSEVADMTEGATRIVGMTLGAGRVTYGEISDDTETVELVAGWTADGFPTLEGHHRFDSYGEVREALLRGEPLIVDDVLADPRTASVSAAWQAIGVRAVVNIPVRERNRVVGLLIVHCGRMVPWNDDEIAFLRNAADRLQIGIERVRAEKRQEILNGEIAHRLKNTLAMVQAIANQSLRQETSEEALGGFARRLQALGVAHDALVSGRSQAADLKHVLAGVVEAAGLEERCGLRGPPVAMGARAALSTSLLVHELLTNAVKYGALSAESGRVEVVWRLEGSGLAREVVLEWSERGGPPAVTPTRKGFGSRLVRLGLVGTGGTDVRYEETGLAGTFRAPLDQVEKA